MTMRHRVSIFRGCAVIAVAVSMLTLAPAASISLSSSSPDRGGYSVIHKNGGTPVWMANALDRAADGIWI